MTELFQMTVAEAAREIREERLSPVALMEALLSRASALESRLRVWVTLDTEAVLETAQASEKELRRNGPRGPLHGVPIGVKDNYYTAGVKTTAGSPIYAEFVPEQDATTVALLKSAGAIIMGKTVTTEFACSDPPPTRNPWNLAHTPGGSSSGSAVGVAAQICPAALGSQTAGSVLRPASYNGVVGLKPTFGLVSTQGIVPVALSLDTVGWFTRTVDDSALILSVLSGHDSLDSSSSGLVWGNGGSIESLGVPPNIGLVGQFIDDRASPEVRNHTHEVIKRLAQAGATVNNIDLPADFNDILSAHQVIMNYEAADVHREDFRARPDDYAPNVRRIVEAGMVTSEAAYAEAHRTLRMFRSYMKDSIGSFDVLLTPSTASEAPKDLSTTGDPAFQTPWTACGFPAIAIPSGLSQSGLPLGIQIVSGPFCEERLLSVAQWCERVLGIYFAPGHNKL